MTQRERRPAAGRLRSVVGPVILTNAGVLLVFLCGPNSEHQILPLAYGGATVALGGAFWIVRTLALRRRADSSTTASDR